MGCPGSPIRCCCRPAPGPDPNRAEEVELVGGSWEQLRIPDYRFPANVRRDLMEFLGPLAAPAKKLCKALLSQTPRIPAQPLRGLRHLSELLPRQGHHYGKRQSQVHPSSCIRCYCCHELCPQKAGAEAGPLGRLLQ